MIGLELGLRPYQTKALKKAAREAGLTFRRALARQGNLQFTLDLETGTVVTDNSIYVHTDSDESA